MQLVHLQRRRTASNRKIRSEFQLPSGGSDTSGAWAPNEKSLDGVTDGARTRDNQYHKLGLYQLSYGHHLGAKNNITFSIRQVRGSNAVKSLKMGTETQCKQQ